MKELRDLKDLTMHDAQPMGLDFAVRGRFLVLHSGFRFRVCRCAKRLPIGSKYFNRKPICARASLNQTNRKPMCARASLNLAGFSCSALGVQDLEFGV